jgi:hypothetical protein
VHPLPGMPRILFAGFVILSAAATAGSAQSLCWTRRPLTECRSWVVSEIGLEMNVGLTSGARVNSYYTIPDFPSRPAFTLGHMFNRGDDHAIGWTAGLAKDWRYGFVTTRLETRYRKWYSTSRAIDLSAGVARKAIHDSAQQRVHAVGITSSAGVSNTYLGVDARVDLLRGDGRFARGGSLGIHTGSQLALPAGVAVLLVWAADRFLKSTFGWLLADWN